LFAINTSFDGITMLVHELPHQMVGSSLLRRNKGATALVETQKVVRIRK
jgi:hypothetical protein